MAVQQRLLVRARDLAGFRQAIVDRAIAGGALAARRRAVLVPTRASAALLRQTIEDIALGEDGDAVVLPELLTRDEWLARLQSALTAAPRLLTRTEREVVMARAAATAGARSGMNGPPFEPRPGLVAAMVDFFDQLRRRQRTVRRFARALFDELRGERGTDRGSEGLIRQTAFLAFAFLAYDRGVAASGAVDEHGLRARLLRDQPSLPFDHVVVAMADHPADPRGLWPADFDLLGRLAGVRTLEIVTTDEMHDAGFRDRSELELPGILEIAGSGAAADERAPVLIRPEGSDADELCHVSRDREDELRTVARAIRAQARETGRLGPTAIVSHRPLPYLYLAPAVLADAGVPFAAWDALPLAAEPHAALLDLAVACGATGGARAEATALLRSPLFEVHVDGERVVDRDVAALDAVLAERRAMGEADTFAGEIEAFFRGRPSRDGWEAARASRAALAAAAVREELLPLRAAGSASQQLRTIGECLRRHEVAPAADDPWRDRHRRGRAAVLATLEELARAWHDHDDEARSPQAIAAALHHVLEARTFLPRRPQEGVHLVDAVAARFCEVDHLHFVGLVDTDWAEGPSRNVFYTSGLLKTLGWPQEADRIRARQASFRDLLSLARATTSLHTFELDGDAIVGRSPMVELARGRPVIDALPLDPSPLFNDELLTHDGVGAALFPAGSSTAEWLRLRLERPPLDDRAYRGFVGAQPPQAYRVSRVDHYVDCPFKYFAENVLRLPEEREESSGLTPLERGLLIHELFEQFYRAWHARGRRTITPADMSEALALFAELTHAALARFSPPDRALEATRLLGSIVATGLAERVFQLEADASERVGDRLLELPLRGTYTFPLLSGLSQMSVEIRGKADRIDVLEDGTLRVIDYKLSKLPDLATSLQIAVYAHCARQALERRDGRPYPIGAAMYVAFGDDRKLEGRLGDAGQTAAAAVQERAEEFARTIQKIEAGEYPARPRRPGDCQWCRYAGVCRKEYLAEEDEAADAL